MYGVVLSSAVKKDIKKLPSQAEKTVVAFILRLTENPWLGEPLKGVLRGYYKCRLSVQGVNYRIVYTIDKKRQLITPLIIGSRENIYKEALQRLQ